MPVDNADYTQGPINAAFDTSYGEYDDQPFELVPKGGSLELLDRSTLEAWANCPYSAANTKPDQECDLLLVAGQAAHDVIGHVIESYIQSGGDMTPYMIREEFDRLLLNSRPDIQQEVIMAAGKIVYPFANRLAGVHPENILGFDGGTKYGRSGQLAKDYPAFGVRATSELDWLCTGDSPEVVEVEDYKTGWKTYTHTDVAKAFQFRMHVVLIFDKYPLVNAINYRVWNTRTNNLTYPVLFKRQQYEQFEAQLRGAVETYHRHRKAPPAWPVYEKCQLCQCVLKCPAANTELKECEADPQAFLKNLAAATAMVERMEKLAKAHVDKTKQDLIGEGIAYGRQAPKREQKSPAKLYVTKESKVEETADES